MLLQDIMHKIHYVHTTPGHTKDVNPTDLEDAFVKV